MLGDVGCPVNALNLKDAFFMTLKRFRLVLSVWFLFLVGLSAASAQIAGLTPDQLRMFQSLSPSQQAAILSAVQGGGGAGIGQMPKDSVPGQVEALPGSKGTSWIHNYNQDILNLLGDEELLVKGDDTLVIVSILKEDAEPGAVSDFMADPNRSRLLGSRLVKLDRLGILDLPGIASIPLAGLPAEDVALRLSAEPLFAMLNFTVTILPLTPSGSAALQPFGYDIFGAQRSVSALGQDLSELQQTGLSGQGAFDLGAADHLPVPRDYVLGPGDTINAQLYGTENYEVTLRVNRDGTINLPKLGPRSVAGLTFGELKDDIEHRVDEQLIGTEVSITMGALRSIQVFVVGDVEHPGGYSLNSLARITHALFSAGGITKIGSLRNIQLKRNGKLVKQLDLYALLLNGDSSNDAQLQAGDVVFIPPATTLVGIDGEIRRPALYELAQGATVEDLLNLAGGLLPAADAKSVRMRRVTRAGVRSVETLDLLGQTDLSKPLQDGDILTIYPVLENRENAVYLGGHVTRPGSYEWQPGMTIADFLGSDKYLRAQADLGYLLIRREVGPNRQASIISADLRAARLQPESMSNILLHQRDHITVFELGMVRSAAIKAVLLELEAQSTHDDPFQMVKISGQIPAPGSYPLEADMHISDLLRAGGGLSAAAFIAEAELTRYIVNGKGSRTTVLIAIDLAAIRAGSAEADLKLAPFDYLNIKEIPAWADQFEVEILGEVRFPGTYPARPGETLSSVLERAGGMTSLAFPGGSVFTRQSLREREAEQLRTLENRLEADLAGLALRASADPTGNAQSAMTVGQSLLEQIGNSQPTGRLVINLDAVLQAAGNPDKDIVLRDGDRLHVPYRSQEVTVLGEVQYATSHLFQDRKGRDSYIQSSGGLTSNADAKRIYVVRANGSVQTGRSSRWFRGGGTKINPGDTIVVPMDTDQMPSLAQWSSITQIIYNLAISVAAVNSF